MNLYDTKSYSLDAGAALDLPLSGVYLRLLDTTGRLLLSMNGGPLSEFPKIGLGPYANPFERVRIENPTEGAVSFTLGYGMAPISDSRVSLTDAVGSSAIATVADVAIGAGLTSQVASANINRRAIMVGNLLANTTVLRIGDANAGAGRGLEVGPGQTVTLDTAAAVYAYNPGGASQSVAIMELV